MACSVSQPARSSCAKGLACGHREQQPGFGVAQDSDTALQVVFELRQARRGIQRHRHAAGIERAVERREELASGRQHHGHRVARRRSHARQGPQPPRSASMRSLA